VVDFLFCSGQAMSRTNPVTVRVPIAVESALSAAKINMGTAKQMSTATTAGSKRVLRINEKTPLDHVERRTTASCVMTVFLLRSTRWLVVIYKCATGLRV
jgi:hypothetical protein